jgi:Sulfotransferase family
MADRVQETAEAASQAAPDGRMAKPIFVMGASGSGTTLLRLILDSHPNIAVGPETAIMRLVKAHRFVPYWRFGKRWWERLDLTEEELNRALRDFYGGFFERLARRQGKRRWGEKTPLHVWHMEEIVKVFDDAVFVAIVRHPGASIASLVERFRFSVLHATNTWLRMNQVLAHDGATMGDRLVLTRYEDLVSEPEPLLRELLDWLEEPWSDAVLQHHDVQQEKGAPDVSDGRTRPGDAIDAERVSKWMTVLTEAERDSVRKKTEGWGRFFGYDIDEPLPVEPLVPSAAPRRFLMTGGELAERRSAFAGQLDLRRPSRPAHEGIFKPPPRRYATRGQPESKLGSVRERLPTPVLRTVSRLRTRVRALRA